MGSRFQTAVRAGFVSTCVGGAWAWISVRSLVEADPRALPLAFATPALAAVVLIGLHAMLPSFGAEALDRPLTWVHPACHVALTGLTARALVTGPYAIEAALPAFEGARLWLGPTSLSVLFVASVGALELLRAVDIRRSAGPVS